MFKNHSENENIIKAGNGNILKACRKWNTWATELHAEVE